MCIEWKFLIFKGLKYGSGMQKLRFTYEVVKKINKNDPYVLLKLKKRSWNSECVKCVYCLCGCRDIQGMRSLLGGGAWRAELPWRLLPVSSRWLQQSSCRGERSTQPQYKPHLHDRHCSDP